MVEQSTTSREKIDVRGGHLVEKVKELVHEGNVRRIIISVEVEREQLETT